MNQPPPSGRRGTHRARGKPIAETQSAVPAAAAAPPSFSSMMSLPSGSAPSEAAPAPPRVKSRGRAAVQKTAPVAPDPAKIAQAFETLSVRSGGNGNGGNGNGGNGNGGTSGSAVRGAIRQRGLELMTRPATLTVKQGTKGTPVQLKANYVGFQTKPNWKLYQYRVDFDPDEERTSVRKAFLKPHKELLGAYIFDGTVLFTCTQLNPEPLEVVTTRRDGETVRVIIKRTTECEWGDHHYLQVFNILVRKAMAGLDLQLVDRDYYDPKAKVEIREFNFEIWPGYLTSVRQHERDILMNVEVSSKIMRNDTALDMLEQCRQRAQGGADWKSLYESSIIGTTVITRYNNKTYRVDDVDYTLSPKSTFKKKGADVSFVEYYHEKYNIKIRNLDQPLLISKPKARDVRGGREELIVLVPEICCLTGISDSMRANFQLMKAMGEHTRISPAARIARLESGFMQRMIESKVTKEELSQWNVSFDPKLINVHGRILPAETVVMGRQGKIELDRNAEFSKQLKRHNMLTTTNISTWVCIYPAKVFRDVSTFSQNLSQSARALNYNIPEPCWEELRDDRPGSYVQAIEKTYNQYKPILILCVLMNNKADKYEAIKKKCYVDRAIPCQCVLAKNLAHKNAMAICEKIAIQINCKLGGSPWGIHFPFKTPVMVVGFDVTHDSRHKSRSVGALVASLNNGFSRYFSAISLHTSGEELSNDIAVQMIKAITKFKSYNDGCVPRKIIFYRDGVGDGNLFYTVNTEVKNISAALKPFYPDEDPRITYIIVTKKINTRVFMNDQNPPPGTIVDDVVTMPERYDFYLVSQSVKQGTVSPSYFNIIYDANNSEPDMIQRLTYKLCHLYFNWSGTVRVPAPVQYAHKLAFLVGQSLRTTPNSCLEDLLYFL